MQRFFVNSCDIDQNDLVLTGNNAKHISFSLRMAPGERIAVCDGKGIDYLCEISRFTSDSVFCKVVERKPNEAEPPYRAVLYQALAKGEKMDYIIQKAVEFGVAEIVPFESSRCIAKLREGSAEKKISRWQRIAEEAAKQCGRGFIPTVSEPMSFTQAIRSCGGEGISFMCYESEDQRSVSELERAEKYSFFIGPEGGFSPDEVETARAAGIIPVSLGKRILRTESASGFVLACLSYHNELIKQ